MPDSEPTSVRGRLRIVAGLHEAVMDSERRAVEVVCIRAGLSKNGNYYAPAVVRAMAPLFEGARAFADHPAPGERPERSIRDIVGYYRDPRVDDAGTLRATLKVARGADWLWDLVREAVEEGQPDLIGLSIDADARVTSGRVDGRDARVVEAITRLNSCDVVTRASAGGRVERLLQSGDKTPRGHEDTKPGLVMGARDRHPRDPSPLVMGAGVRGDSPRDPSQRVGVRGDSPRDFSLIPPSQGVVVNNPGKRIGEDMSVVEDLVATEGGAAQGATTEKNNKESSVSPCLRVSVVRLPVVRLA